MKPGEILILTGPPGAGKITIAEALTKTARVPAVHLHADDFWRFIKCGYVSPYRTEANSQNQVVIDAVAFAAKCYARGDYFVVVDGIIGPWFLDRFHNVVDVPLHYIVLYPDLGTVLARARRRPGDALKKAKPIQDLHEQFASLGDLKSHIINTSEQPIETTLAIVNAAIMAGSFRL